VFVVAGSLARTAADRKNDSIVETFAQIVQMMKSVEQVAQYAAETEVVVYIDE